MIPIQIEALEGSIIGSRHYEVYMRVGVGGYGVVNVNKFLDRSPSSSKLNLN